MISLIQEVMLDVPQFLGEVHVVVVGVGKAADFLPHAVPLLLAMAADLLQGGQVVDQLAVLEDGHQ